MEHYFSIFIAAMLINNVILSQFLGICPFLGVSKKMSTAVGMSGAVLFVIVMSCMVTYPVWRLLNRFNLNYMRTIIFILLIATLVQLVEIILRKMMPSLYKALGVYLPLITTNCAVLGTTIKAAEGGFSLLESIVYSLGVSCGFFLAIVIMAGIRERLDNNKDIPKAFQGMPITLITAGLMAIAFFGFGG
ncbi:MAG: RnfABCDGE type electron transport complex subunit A [Lachnospiraceae bacterium]|nr:RnfABCDGE type electron transport complex subunit A [Lachnoclostridium sp.]MDD7521010.1 RnfABCDGE type electron transport complex subunit A [Lachnoclostridium sp.]MDY2599918.1 RnfABCDGE type electron transport complex subunit A [Lachnospiraceae bacterium]